MITTCSIFTGNHTVVELQELTDIVSGTNPDDATVTMTLLDREGDAVSGETWPVTLAYVSGTLGTYRVILDSQIGVQPGEHYTAVVNATTPGMMRAHWELDVFAQVRRG